MFKEWLENTEITLFTTINDWLDTYTFLSEATLTRYSIEINYRSNKKEVLEAFAKICLGYVSAALKQDGYSVKHVYDEHPIRILISSRMWDDGEYVGIASFNHEHDCFIISKGFYNKDRRTTSIISSKRCDGDNASEIAKELRNLMHSLKNEKDRHSDPLKPAKLQRGPKR